MTIPDKLIAAAADSVMAQWALFRAPTSGGTELVRSEYEEVLKGALAAAFAALPECDEAVMDVAEHMPHGWRDDDGVPHYEVSRGNYEQAKAYLAALARMAQP